MDSDLGRIFAAVLLGWDGAPGVDCWVSDRPAVLQTFFCVCAWPPLHRGVPGEGPDCNCPEEIEAFGPIQARNSGELFYF